MALSTIVNWTGPAVSTIASSAGSAVVENIVSTAYSFLYNRMLPADIEAELKRLQAALPQITAVMGIAEALKMKHPPASKWVEQFREALEASEDLLDELEYKRLENMAEQSNEVSGSASSSKKQKFNPIMDDTLERLREAVRMLDQAAASVGSLLQLATALGVHGFSESWQEFGKSLNRETTSFLAEREVFGREVEKDKIISWLKQPTQSKLSSFGIIGVGGQGKTTLAQFAYQELGRSNHFDKRIWVCVSINFSVEDLTRKILGELGESCLDGKPLNALQECLKGKILSKKILLILDDIWDDENRRGWEQLFAPLRFAGEGSKILFTTRMKSVAELIASVINIEHQSLPLDGLAEQHLRLLFYSYAFWGVNHDNQRELKEIGDQMLKMLRGSPLAAKVIGSLLNSCMDHHYWRRILNHGSLFYVDQAKDVVEVLKLSYYHLPADLQVCFRFCSIFPQDFEFEKDSLIKMWMGAGFIPQQVCDKKRPEDVGEDYFNHLLRKSFFEHSKSLNGKYVMHDLVHELALNVSNAECCRLEPNDKSFVIPNSVRHISIHESEIERITHLENLHSLLITNSFPLSKQDPFVLSNKFIKKSLRLLRIVSYNSYQLPNEISHLVHLRYLSINTGYRPDLCNCWLSTSIHKLYNLQILDFQGIHKGSSYFGIEPDRMNNLVRLRYMRFPAEIMRTITGVHKMTSLQELTFYVGKESGHRINELHTLNNLCKLFICDIENVGDPAEAKNANLLVKKNLTSLSLKWTSESNPNYSEQIIDNLQPNPDLMSLTIEHYKGLRSPSWMEDSSPLYLSSLNLLNCPKLKGQLFSCQMPYLKLLVIHECPELEELPDMPLSLTEFRVKNVGLTSLPNLWQSSDDNTSVTVSQKSSLKIVEIEGCPNLISLHGFLQQGNVDLHVIEELAIMDCENLKYIPTQRFENLTSLKYLHIIDCPNLTRSPYIPHSLTKLEIDNVAVDSLPEYNTSSDSITGPSATSLKISLRTVRICYCPNLTLLDGFLQQRHIDFQSIKYMYLVGCRNLVQLPIGAFGKFLSLEDLTVVDCPMLVADNNQSNLLPSTLKKLTIRNCGELEVELVESASHLTTLEDLCMVNCTSITHIPCSENTFRSLSALSITKCGKLIEHSSREPAQGINVHGSNLASLKVNVLEIDHLSLLLIEPLRSLKKVSDLTIRNCSGVDAFPEEWLQANNSTLRRLTFEKATLKSLPAAIATFTTLEMLQIFGSDLLEEIQELPASLRTLTMCDAKSLKSLPATIASLTKLEEVIILDADSLEKLPEFPRSLKVKDIQRSDGTYL